MLRFIDTETCGLVGPIVTIQYNTDNDVCIWDVWEQPVINTLLLIEQFCSEDVCAFNLAFDWFHLTKIYNLFVMVSDRTKLPIPEELAEISNNTTNRPIRFCLKPKGALDLMLLCRKNEYQTVMDRNDIRIRKVPLELGNLLACELEKRLDIPGIFFIKRKEGYEWKVEPHLDHPIFCDVVLKWGASSGLKPLCSHIFKVNTIDYPIPRNILPPEDSYNPYDTRWLGFIREHIKYWKENKTAREYAIQDIILQERLYEHLGNPEPNDTDSILACAVGATRWCGFAIDTNRLVDEYKETKDKIKLPIQYNSHQQVRQWLAEAAPNPTTAALIKTSSTGKEYLKKYKKSWPDTELANRAEQILEARHAEKKIDLLEKLAHVGRFCPELKVIGTRSGRMSGGGEDTIGGSINPQGIQKSTAFRSIFTLADNDTTLSGGDFADFEVRIADADYNDSILHQELVEGKKLYPLIGMHLFETDYDTIMATKPEGEGSMYDRTKKSGLALIYGAMASKLAKTAEISEEKAESGYREFMKKYPDIHKARMKTFERFCSMSQPNGIGTPVVWRDPDEYIESLLGFRRYFTLENMIVKCLFNLANRIPQEFHKSGIVNRGKRDQTLAGATQSALYATAFQLQAANMRAAANHRIQSTGAEITKGVQRTLWELQPVGVHEWHVKLLNIHDEILCVHKPELTREIVFRVQDTVERYKRVVPLLKLDWKCDFKHWGEKD